METVDIHYLKAGEINLGVRVLSCLETVQLWLTVPTQTDIDHGRTV